MARFLAMAEIEYPSLLKSEDIKIEPKSVFHNL